MVLLASAGMLRQHVLPVFLTRDLKLASFAGRLVLSVFIETDKTDLDQGLNQPDQQQQPPEDSIASQDTARCDVFYLHPTTYFSGKGWNAPHDEESAALMVDEGILFQQAAAFHNGCRIYAPRYRQMTGTGYVDRVNGDLALDVAYEDIKRAFESFMFRRQTECMRSIILASHSQGTTLCQKKYLNKLIIININKLTPERLL